MFKVSNFRTHLKLNTIIAVLVCFILTSVRPLQADETSSQGRLKLRQSLIDFAYFKLPEFIKGYAWKLQTTHWSHQDFAKYSYFWKFVYKGIPELPFRYVDDETFKVVGVDPDRIAINTGKEILWNARRLAEMPDFSLQQAVQILMHEIGHQVSEVSSLPHFPNADAATQIKITLEQKDKFATEFANYLKSNTLSARTKEGKQFNVTSLDIPDKLIDLIDYKYSRDFKYLLRSRFVIWQEESNYFEDLTQKFISMLVVDNQRFRGIRPFHWIDFESLRLNSQGESVLKIKQTPRFYDERGYKVDMPLAQPEQISFSFSEINRDFRTLLNEAEFKILSSVDKENQRFVTIELTNVSDPILNLGSKRMRLLAREPSTGKRFSFEVSKAQMKKGQVRLIIPIPQNYELIATEILIFDSQEQKYQEYSVLPRDLQIIPGVVREAEGSGYRNKYFKNKYELDTFDAWFGPRDSLFSLSLPRNMVFSKVKGITIENVAPVEARWKDQKSSDFAGVHFYKFSLGQKVYLNQEQLKKFLVEKDPQRSAEFDIQMAGRGFNDVEIDNLVVFDSYERFIKKIWVHLDDGEVIPLEFKRGSSDQGRIRNVYKEKFARYAKEERRRQFELRSCKNLFSN